MLILAWIGLVTVSLVAGLIVGLIIGGIYSGEIVKPDEYAFFFFFGPIALITGFLIYRCTIGATP